SIFYPVPPYCDHRDLHSFPTRRSSDLQIRSTGGVRLWSNAIDSVSGYLQRNHSERPVKVVDWGFQHSLFVLSNSKISSTELFWGDRKSTRLNSSHEWISYAVFCLKKKS